MVNTFKQPLTSMDFFSNLAFQYSNITGAQEALSPESL